jgi:Zinc finger, ZZ type
MWWDHETRYHILRRGFAQYGQNEVRVRSRKSRCTHCDRDIVVGVSFCCAVCIAYNNEYHTPNVANCKKFSLFSAPISKVIDYLPKNIPRILINRTIVHPPEPIEEEDDDNNDDDGGLQLKRHDFRKNYVFDAYLLGYCDVVTRALGHDLFSNDATSSNTNKGLLDAALLSTVLKSDNPYANPMYHADEWSSVPVPTERVFLFEGAQPPPTVTTASTGSHNINNAADEISFREIAHCDGCTKRIQGTIQKCVVCFDYDLCQQCFPTLSKVHYDGKHHFAPEAVLTD